MSKLVWKPGTMVYPVPAVMVSCGNFQNNTDLNIITIAWTGTINTNPAMAYISINPSRYSYDIIKKHKSFVINITTEALVYATDFCGVKSGRNVDKFKELKLTPAKSEKVNAPSIAESPINIECRLKEIVPLGSHHMFIGEVQAVCVDDQYMDENGRFHLDEAKPICYSHGQYFGLGKNLGKFGYSVQKSRNKKRK